MLHEIRLHCHHFSFFLCINMTRTHTLKVEDKHNDVSEATVNRAFEERLNLGRYERPFDTTENSKL